LEHAVHLDRGVTARIEDLAGTQLGDGKHGARRLGGSPPRVKVSSGARRVGRGSYAPLQRRPEVVSAAILDPLLTANILCPAMKPRAPQARSRDWTPGT